MKSSLPPNWSWVKLGDVCERITKGSTPTSYGFKYQNSGINFVKTENIDSEGNVFGVQEFINDEANDFLNRSKLKTDDILFSIAGTIGRVGVIREKNLPANTNQALAIVRLSNNNLFHPFIYYYFKSPSIQKGVLKKIVGVGRANLSLTNVAEFEIPFPPLREQKKIVAKIEELFSELDNGIEQLKKAKQQLRIYRQAVLSWAFSGRLLQSQRSKVKSQKELLKAAEPEVSYIGNGLPDGWKWVKFKDVCKKIQDGSHFSPKNQYSQKTNERYLYLTSKNIRNNYLDLTGITYVDKKFHDSIFPRCNPEFGDVLLTKDGANTGNVTLNTLTEEFSLLSSVCLIKPNKEKLKSPFIKYYLQSPIGFKEITGAMTGTAIKRIILKNIKEAKIVLPPKEEQHQIVSEIESRFSVAEKLEQAIDENLKKSETLRQSILKKAFEGKLV